MSEEVIRYGAGGVPYVGKQQAEPATPVPEATQEKVKPEEEPTVTVTVTETETPGDISVPKKGRKQK